ncbi:hypothetical protein D3C81_1700300 [compost metagenome]
MTALGEAPQRHVLIVLPEHQAGVPFEVCGRLQRGRLGEIFGRRTQDAAVRRDTVRNPARIRDRADADQHVKGVPPMHGLARQHQVVRQIQLHLEIGMGAVELRQ